MNQNQIEKEGHDMFGIKSRVEIYKKKDKATWDEIKRVLDSDGSIDYKAGHYFQETVARGGCGAKLDPRDFGSKGKIDRDIYWVKVASDDADRARETLLKAGVTPVIEDNILEDASRRVAGAENPYFK